MKELERPRGQSRGKYLGSNILLISFISLHEINIASQEVPCHLRSATAEITSVGTALRRQRRTKSEARERPASAVKRRGGARRLSQNLSLRGRKSRH
ncbi:hypothetical protein EVAR_85999_1 [Eumeta japonica]|uniref:Uncharacterized protein n=1 Tax=Eumeta variegata TaxID=151549 RepID=A0A4C1UK77_EUMVA|nr:hypothetical protein EVAR_85999_1 [Eumeta japonica]